MTGIWLLEPSEDEARALIAELGVGVAPVRLDPSGIELQLLPQSPDDYSPRRTWGDSIVRQVQAGVAQAAETFIGLLPTRVGAPVDDLVLRLTSRPTRVGSVASVDLHEAHSARIIGTASGNWVDLAAVVRSAIASGLGGAHHAMVSTRVELLIGSLLKALDDDRSELRRQLEDARIEVAFLRGQVLALREAVAIDRKPITRSVLAVVGTVLLALGTGAAGGAAQAGIEHGLRAEGEPSAFEFVQECEAIQQMLSD